MDGAGLTMATSLTAGEIYLVAEIDPRTHLATDYCKIGIVREKDGDDRDSGVRAKEHQTGNPRELVVADVVKTAMVEAVETVLHHRFAPKRLSGEWFYMTAEERARAMDVARELAQRAESGAADLAVAKQLGETPSTDETLPASADVIAALGIYVAADARVARAGEMMGRIKVALAADIVEKGGKTRAGTVMERRGREEFDEASFTAEYPELAAEFHRETAKVSGQFRMTKNVLVDESEDLTALSVRLDATLGQPAGDERNTALHGIHLECMAASAVSEWDSDLAEARIKVLCGTASGIEGVCKWKRTTKVTVSLDKKALKSAHPEEYGRHAKQGGTVTTTVIAKDTGFRH
jgi:hypothetical protein